MAEMKKEWYVVNTYAGHENKVKDNLQRRVETMGLQDALFQIVVAEETEIEYKNGKEVEKMPEQNEYGKLVPAKEPAFTQEYKKAENAAVAGIVIGLTLAFVHIMGIPLTGTSVNSARV